ncbi:slipin family protein [Pseudomonas sp. F1_0610]|uniref:slipin family protein n=1 Tax=Pseudomonas sp. F1_0610 TaxID=3114284 RepID=UPI0039C2263C
MLNKVTIKNNEIALVRNKDGFSHVLTTGEYRFWLIKPAYVVFNLDQPVPNDVAKELRRFHKAWVEKYCIEVNLNNNQIALRYVDGRLTQVLEPASQHLYWKNGIEQQHEVHHLNTRAISQELANNLRHQHADWVKQYCIDVQVAEHQVGLRYVDGVLTELLEPNSRYLWWKNGSQQQVEFVSLAELEIKPELLKGLRPLMNKKAIDSKSLLLSTVPAWHLGVLKVDDEVKQVLPAGSYGFWTYHNTVAVQSVDTRLRVLDMSGQEILTKDKVSIRLNFVINWRYVDVLTALAAMQDAEAFLYREVQFALREIVGTRTLDELLENKEIIDQQVTEQLSQSIPQYGLEIGSMGVKDIILPGEMRTILSSVIEAEKAAQANVIRRREETAATRSLLNTAKVMENNPVALRLKELETLERVCERIDKISVFGGLDQVLNGLVNLKGIAK